MHLSRTKISVITPARDAARAISCTIESFLSQSHPDKELILIDGASHDATLDIVRSFNSPQIRIFSETDKGPYDAMNKGLQLFDGQAVGILNAGDTFHDDAVLEQIASGLEDADIVYADVRMVLDQINKKVIRAWRAGPFNSRLFQLGWMPPHPTFYARRSVIAQIEAFDTRYRVAADYDFMLRAMVLHDFRIRYIPEILIDFEVGGMSQNWRAMLRTQFESLQSRRENLQAPFVDLALFLRPLWKLAQVRGHYFRWFLKSLHKA